MSIIPLILAGKVSNTCDAGTEGINDAPLGPAPWDVSIATSDADLHRFIGHQKAKPKVWNLGYWP